MPDVPRDHDNNLMRAALVLSLLGTDEAVEVTRRVDPLAAHKLIRSLGELGDDGGPEAGKSARLDALRAIVARLRGDHGGPRQLATQLRESVLNVQQHLPTVNNVDIGAFYERIALLDTANPALIWRAIGGETPQAIALVVSHLSPANVARLLAAMPPEVRDEVAYRLIVQGPPTPDAVAALSIVTEHFLQVASTGGEAKESQIGQFVEIVSQMDRESGRDVIAAIRERNDAAATAIEQSMFTFHDLLKLPSVAIQVILRNITTSDLALALKGAIEVQREVVLANLSQRARAVLEEEINLLGAVPVSDVERAQRSIVQAARGLEAAGELQLTAGNVQYVE